MTLRPASQEIKSLGLALALGLAFMLLSFIRTWGDMGSMAFGGRVIESTLDQPILGTRLALRLFGFLMAELTVHLTLGLASWFLGLASRRIWQNSPNGPAAWTCLWFLILALWVLAANAKWYPSSRLGGPYADLVNGEIAGIGVFAVFTGIVVLATGYVVARSLFRVACALDGARRAFAAVLLALPIAGYLSIGLANSPSPATSDPDRPHVVLVGIDSLRPDVVEGGAGPVLTPAMDKFLMDASVLTDTLTPLARTFPAWVSIVSGRHPHTTGAVVNLFPRALIDDGDTLPDLLRRSGYRTIYAIDETRFSNLDESYGFDQMISPPIGAADFLLGFLHDLPLSNLITNTPLGRFLFPFGYANRAAASVYDPDTFIGRLNEEISFVEPTFLAVHFTLPHWPYTWASSPRVEDQVTAESVSRRYFDSVRRVDRQFGDLMQQLSARGVLKNAIVVLMSDHGESLGEQSVLDDGHGRDNSVFGHGTDVLALNQYQVLLAFRSFGRTPLSAMSPRRIGEPATLEDIAPTFVDLLGVQTDESFDGVSLLPLLLPAGETQPEWPARIRFLETEFNPPGISVDSIPGTSQLADAATTYRVDPETDRLSLRPGMLDEILNGRQFAAVSEESVLAALPDADNRNQYLVYIEGDARPIWLSDPPDRSWPVEAHELWSALNARFHKVSERPIVAPAGSRAEHSSWSSSH